MASYAYKLAPRVANTRRLDQKPFIDLMQYLSFCNVMFKSYHPQPELKSLFLLYPPPPKPVMSSRAARHTQLPRPRVTARYNPFVMRNISFLSVADISGHLGIDWSETF